MEKASLSGEAVLSVRGRFEAFRSCPNASLPLHSPYSLKFKRGDRVEVLPGVQWADWTFDGHLATATGDGILRISSAQIGRVVKEARLVDEDPQPSPAPVWAADW